MKTFGNKSAWVKFPEITQWTQTREFAFLFLQKMFNIIGFTPRTLYYAALNVFVLFFSNLKVQLYNRV